MDILTERPFGRNGSRSGTKALAEKMLNKIPPRGKPELASYIIAITYASTATVTPKRSKR